MRHVSDEERRARMGRRQALAAAGQVASPEAATMAMVALHATEPATPYLSCWARVQPFELADLERALLQDRTLVKQLAMRRTLFVFPRDLLPVVWPSASARVARTEGARTAKDVVRAGAAADGDAWLEEARAEVVAALAAAPEGLTAAEVRAAAPMVAQKLAVAGGEVAAAARVLTHLGATGDVVRGANAGRWYTSRPRWTLTHHWLGDLEGLGERWTPDDGYRELIRRWLRSFGPGSTEDLVWWLGATKAIVGTALSELGAVAVGLDGGGSGWLLPDDLDEEPPSEPWVALLPVLDPTAMGWRGRDWYLGPHGSQLFDRNGNAGTTAWVDGRAVGCWTQDAGGVVRVHLLEDVPDDARGALESEASRLTSWLAGTTVGSVYTSPSMRAARSGGPP